MGADLRECETHKVRIAELEAANVALQKDINNMLRDRRDMILRICPKTVMDRVDTREIEHYLRYYRYHEPVAVFQNGDSYHLKSAIGLLRAVAGPETMSDDILCLERLLKAARAVEDALDNPEVAQ